jgi:hypothetical protein
MFGMVLWTIIAPRKTYATDLKCNKLCNLYRSPSIVGMVKSRALQLVTNGLLDSTKICIAVQLLAVLRMTQLCEAVSYC